MTPSAPKPALLHDFLEGRLDPAQFHHREHVRIGYELLEQHPFSEALFYLSAGLRLLAAKAGHPEVYHETITTAFLSFISERCWQGEYLDFDDFARRNPDLMQKEFLGRIYEPAVLQSQLAREAFILPRSRGSATEPSPNNAATDLPFT